ncbi:hypothetical protein [Caballeronia sp. DA-9]|uniref:hypothetical protein n=1 Tax=Caballeronia sp. DA-9 TaxID=3436237 RepID=UPI003F670775
MTRTVTINRDTGAPNVSLKANVRGHASRRIADKSDAYEATKPIDGIQSVKPSVTGVQGIRKTRAVQALRSLVDALRDVADGMGLSREKELASPSAVAATLGDSRAMSANDERTLRAKFERQGAADAKAVAAVMQRSAFDQRMENAAREHRASLPHDPYDDIRDLQK